MQNREISIGRDKRCDIVIDSSYNYVSNRHASIISVESHLLFRDNSTNGSLVNNVVVHNRTVQIKPFDSILLAGKYPLSWAVINSYFPEKSAGYDVTRIDYVSRQEEATPSVPVGIQDWNWGAFALYPIWGFWNGCWWAILISLFLGALWPIPNIIFGIYGSRWSWENKRWDSALEFSTVQSAWKPWGICMFVLSLLSIFWWIPFLLYMYSTIL